MAFGTVAPAMAQTGTAALNATLTALNPNIRSGEQATFQVAWACSSVTVDCAGMTVSVPIDMPSPADRHIEKSHPTFVSASPSSGGFSGNPVYNAQTRTITWKMSDTVPAGRSGTMNFTLQTSRPYTMDGATISPVVTVDADNVATPATATASTTVTGEAYVGTSFTQPTAATPAVGSPVEYRVVASRTPSSGATQLENPVSPDKNRIITPGTIGLTEVETVVTVPAGVTSVEASHGGVYDPETNTVTWPKWNDNDEGGDYLGRPDYTLKVVYPESFINQQVTLTAKTTAKEFGSGELLTSNTRTITHSFTTPTPRGIFAKWNGVSSPGDPVSGNSLAVSARGLELRSSWSVSANNTGNVPIHVHTVDYVPCGFVSPKDGSTNCKNPDSIITAFKRAGAGKSAASMQVSWVTNLGNTGQGVITSDEPLKVEGLASGEAVTKWEVQADLGVAEQAQVEAVATTATTVPEFAPDSTQYARADVPKGKGAPVIVENTATATFTNPATGAVVGETTANAYMRVENNPRPSFSVEKEIIGSTNLQPGQTVGFSLNIRNSGLEKAYPVYTDLLPKGLTFTSLRSARAQLPQIFNNREFTTANVNVETVDDWNGTGRQLVRFSFPEDMGFIGGGSFYLTFNALVGKSAPEGVNTNTFQVFDRFATGIGTESDPTICNRGRGISEPDADNKANLGDPNRVGCEASVNYTVAPSPAIGGVKQVKGSRDKEFKNSPDFGYVDLGAPATFRLNVTNEGNTPLKNVIAYDLLPFVGDTGVGPAHMLPRESEWTPDLTGPVKIASNGVTAEVRYSTSNNPWREEVTGTGGAAALPADFNQQWLTADQITDWSSVNAIRIQFDKDLVLKPQETWVAEVSIKAPIEAEGVAWNSFAVTAQQAANDRWLLPVEPPKVGLQLPVDLKFSKSLNPGWVIDGQGTNATTASKGAKVRYSLTVNNEGQGRASGIVAVDKLPAGLTLLQEETKADNGTFDPETFTWTLADPLDPLVRQGEEGTFPNTATLELVATVTGEPGQEICNTATMTSRQTPDPVESKACFTIGAAVTGTLWHDSDDDAVIDEGEQQRFAGVTVELVNGKGEVVATAVTAEDGSYKFTGVELGDYTVRVNPAGLPESETEWLNSAKQSNERKISVKGDLNGVDFGFLQPASIGDTVWLDENNDGVQGAGERPLADVTVKLVDAGGKTVASVKTDAEGKYSFPGLRPGAYTVEYETPAGYVPASAEQGADRGVDSNPNKSAVTVVSGETNNSVDFGFVGAGVIGDLVFEDTNGNGKHDAGEPGVAGVVVTLLNAAGEPVDVNGNVLADGAEPVTAVTGADGKYRFERVVPGDYKVRVAQPDGFVQSFGPGEGELSLTSGTVSLTPAAMTNLDQDFGFYRPASIGDTVWLDGNDNGVRDAGESGIAGVEVHLLNAAGDPVTDAAGDPVVVTTDAEGKYSFPGLRPGDYQVKLVLPSKNAYAATVTGADNKLAELNAGEGVITPVTVVSGQERLDVDAAVKNAGVITGKLFNDDNGDGVQDAGEGPFNGVTVELVDPATGNVIATAVTNDAGGYRFANLAPGDYQVRVKTDTLPAGYSQSSGPAAGGVYDVALSDESAESMVVNDRDFGYAKPVRVGDRVWLDKDGDGIQDPAEPGLAGVVVNLLDRKGEPVLNGDGEPLTATTNEQGLYSFDELPAGTYTVKFDLPAGFTASPADAGNGRDDSRGESYTFTISGKDVARSDIDFGVVGTGVITGSIFNDGDRDGVFDGAENTFENVVVGLYDADGNPVLDSEGKPITAVTDKDGGYVVEKLWPGEYTLRIVDVPAGYKLTTDEVLSVELTPEQMTAEQQDFGLIGAGKVTGTVWNDADRSNLPDPSKGFPNVKVNLFDAQGELIGTSETDENGFFEFGDLEPGSYTVKIDPDTVPAGFEFSFGADGWSVTLDAGNEWTAEANFGLVKSPEPIKAAPRKPGLAITGSSGEFAVIGVILVALAAGVLLVAGRRKEEQES
ncbi:SdrD B-like domain-containing protein [Canibacter zhoujuaniae]|uniref:SdrD B-like domain-containing protein n=1 Tax=Canibacter zhoujuaniae TaxID=2708343 RepID=UPI00141E3ED3|nr:SdrD B-like domain-containing protein [Canibacter zhoujuaniae]